MIIMRLGYVIKDFFKRTINDLANIGYIINNFASNYVLFKIFIHSKKDCLAAILSYHN